MIETMVRAGSLTSKGGVLKPAEPIAQAEDFYLMLPSWVFQMNHVRIYLRKCLRESWLELHQNLLNRNVLENL